VLLFGCFCSLVASFILALVLSWDVALVGFSPLLILIPVGIMEVISFGRYETLSETPTVAAVSYATESIDAVKTVAAYGRETQVVEQFDRLQQPEVKKHRDSLALGSLFFGLGQASFPLLVVLVFWYGGDKYAKGQISITNLFAVFESSFIGAFGVGKAFGTLLVPPFSSRSPSPSPLHS
jgi:ATP-binding cassette subfamily B (MDR/TAP) protein 1